MADAPRPDPDWTLNAENGWLYGPDPNNPRLRYPVIHGLDAETGKLVAHALNFYEAQRNGAQAALDRVLAVLTTHAVLPPADHGPGRCVTVEDANRVLAQERAATARMADALDRVRACITKLEADAVDGDVWLLRQNVLARLNAALDGTEAGRG